MIAHFLGYWLITSLVCVNLWAWGRALHKHRQHSTNRDANLDRVVLEFARGRKLSSHTKAR